MSSVAQINANRANAQHSTGPKTQAGQEACKYNRTAHGLCSRKIVITGEDPAEYERLHSSLLEQWKPSNEIESMLVEQLSQNWWRLERARGIENEMLEKYGKTEAYENKAFLALQRQLGATERAWNRALRDMQNLRTITVDEKKEEFHVAAARSFLNSMRDAGATAETPKIGSVPAIPQNAAVQTPKTGPVVSKGEPQA